jgi:hypothetical protein
MKVNELIKLFGIVELGIAAVLLVVGAIGGMSMSYGGGAFFLSMLAFSVGLAVTSAYTFGLYYIVSAAMSYLREKGEIETDTEEE